MYLITVITVSINNLNMYINHKYFFVLINIIKLIEQIIMAEVTNNHV